MAFKDAHRITGRVVRLACAEGLPSGSVTARMVAQASREVVGRELILDEHEIRNAFDSNLSIARRAGSGGPAMEDVHSFHRLATEETAAMYVELRALNDRIVDASSKLETALTEL